MLVRAISLSAWRGMVAWRWLLLVPGFGVGAVIMKESLEFFFMQNRISRQADAWDLFPTIVFHDYALLLFGLGFMLLSGDKFRRDQEQGAVSLSVVRMPSRSLFWLGEMGALGIMALCFASLGLVISLLVGMLFAPPLSFWPMLPRESIPGMYPDVSLPMPLYVVLLMGYSAWTLWVASCAISLLSLFIPHKTGVLAVIVLWAVSSLSWSHPRYPGYARLIDLGYLIGFSKHQGADSVPMGGFFVVTGAIQVLIAIAGSLRLRHEEL